MPLCGKRLLERAISRAGGCVWKLLVRLRRAFFPELPGDRFQTGPLWTICLVFGLPLWDKSGISSFTSLYIPVYRGCDSRKVVPSIFPPIDCASLSFLHFGPSPFVDLGTVRRVGLQEFAFLESITVIFSIIQYSNFES